MLVTEQNINTLPAQYQVFFEKNRSCVFLFQLLNLKDVLVVSSLSRTHLELTNRQWKNFKVAGWVDLEFSDTENEKNRDKWNLLITVFTAQYFKAKMETEPNSRSFVEQQTRSLQFLTSRFANFRYFIRKDLACFLGRKNKKVSHRLKQAAEKCSGEAVFFALHMLRDKGLSDKTMQCIESAAKKGVKRICSFAAYYYQKSEDIQNLERLTQIAAENEDHAFLDLILINFKDHPQEAMQKMLPTLFNGPYPSVKAYLACHEKDPEKAERLFSSAVEGYKNDLPRWVVVNIISNQVALKKYREAEAYIDRFKHSLGIQLMTGDPTPQLFLDNAYFVKFKLEKYEEANVFLEKLIELDPSVLDVQLIASYIFIKIKLNKYSDIKSLYNIVRGKEKLRDAFNRYVIALAYEICIKQKKKTEAGELLDLLVVEDIKDLPVDNLFMAAIIKYNSRHHQVAEYFVELALKKRGESIKPQDLFWGARIKYALSKFEEAEVLAERAKDYALDVYDLMTLAFAKGMVGKYLEALSYFEKAKSRYMELNLKVPADLLERIQRIRQDIVDALNS